MKINNLSINRIFGIAMCAVMLAFASCRKENSSGMGFTPGKGTPSISGVYAVYRSDTVTVDSLTYVLANSDGATTRDSAIAGKAPSIVFTPIDSAVADGSLSDYYLICGSNLGSATAVYFNGLNAYFNRALSTDTSIVVQIPANTPYLPPVTDSLTIVTTNGTVHYYFPIRVPPPTPNTYSDFVFQNSSTITLIGVGFSAVTSVALKDAEGGSATTNLSITYQSEDTMVLKFPSSTSINQGTLVFSYTDLNADDYGTAKTAAMAQQLVNADNAYQILGPNMTADPTQTWAAVFQNNGASTGWVANGWSGWATSNSVVHGIAAISFYGQFDNGGWKVAGFQWNSGVAGSLPALAYDPSYQYLCFWVINTGAAVTQTAYINWGDAGLGQNRINPITLQQGVWQFFKIPISSLAWNTGTTPWSANSSETLQNVAWFLTCQDSKGSNIGEADLYFADVMLVK